MLQETLPSNCIKDIERTQATFTSTSSTRNPAQGAQKDVKKTYLVLKSIKISWKWRDRPQLNSWIEAPSTVLLIFYEVMEKEYGNILLGDPSIFRKQCKYSELYVNHSESYWNRWSWLRRIASQDGLLLEAWIQDETARPKLLQLAQYLGNSKIQEEIACKIWDAQQ